MLLLYVWNRPKDLGYPYLWGIFYPYLWGIWNLSYLYLWGI